MGVVCKSGHGHFKFFGVLCARTLLKEPPFLNSWIRPWTMLIIRLRVNSKLVAILVMVAHGTPTPLNFFLSCSRVSIPAVPRGTAQAHQHWQENSSYFHLPKSVKLHLLGQLCGNGHIAPEYVGRDISPLLQ